MRSACCEPIDFVIPWVDGSDEEWLRAKSFHEKGIAKAELARDDRYREWGLLKYWFRSVEEFAPWACKIHFITWGHLPTWLNTDHPKLNIVRHEDFIPSQYLPTFSSHPIELNIHRIVGLSNRFVYFNDDMYLTRPVGPESFFKDGLPRATAALVPSRVSKGDWFCAPINNVATINDNFDYRKSIRSNIFKWINPRYGIYNFVTALMLPYRSFYGFFESHLPNSYLKSTLEEVWEAEFDILNETSLHKIRDRSDVNQWLFENWQLAKGEFSPRSPKFGKAFYLTGGSSDALKELCTYISDQKGDVVCVNDGPMSYEEYEAARQLVIEAFEAILPNKSSFER